MAMDSTLQVRMDSDVKTSVEALYREMGTTFAEAVRIFAKQSLLSGGMPFCPTLKTWDELSEVEVDKKLLASEADIVAGRVLSQADVDARMKGKFRHGE